MRIKSFPSLTIILISSFVGFQAVVNGEPGEARKSPPFTQGERLLYEVSWLGMKVGTGTLEVKPREFYQNRETLHLVSTTRSNGLAALFFPVEDQIESYADKDGMFSYFIRVQQHHGARRVHKEVTFDQEHHQATMVYKGKTRTFLIPPQVHDSLSSLYSFRAIGDLAVGQSIFMDVHESKKNWKLEIQILGRERITIPIGTFNTIKVMAKVRYEGVLLEKGDVLLWVTDDEYRVPVQMKGRSPIGTITASLASADLPTGLKPAR